MDDKKYGDAKQTRLYRQTLERLGEEVIRHRVTNRMPIGDSADNNPPHAFAQEWLAEKALARAKAENRRYLNILAVAVISAVAAVVAAVPVVKSWIAPP